MPRRKTPGTAPFSLDISLEAKSRFPACTTRWDSRRRRKRLRRSFMRFPPGTRSILQVRSNASSANSIVSSKVWTKHMKNGMIFARKSTWRSRLDLEYLDETSRAKNLSGARRSLLNRKSHESSGNLRDYASKETLGQVHAGGFLHRPHPCQRGRIGIATFELRTTRKKETNLRIVVSAPPQISHFIEESRHSTSPRLFHVAGTARQASCRRHQS